MKETLKVNYEDLWKDTSGKEPKNHSPVLDYCRKLIKEGIPSNSSLEVYRHEELSMLVKNIGLGAKQTIRENEDVGPIFTKYREIDLTQLKKLRSISNRKAVEALPIAS